MNYKVVVPDTISGIIGTWSLSRSLTIRLLTAIHAEIPRDYEDSRRYRLPGYEEFYRYRTVLTEGEATHVFRFAVDDSTAPGHLILMGIKHDLNNNP